MKYNQAKRLDHFQTGIFAAMDEKKNKLLESGMKVYNLSIGTPDFKPYQHIIDAVSESVKDPLNYKYSLVDSDQMMEAVVEYYHTRYNTMITPQEITSVHGTQEGMGHLGMAMCDPGDIVLLPNPGYPIFEVGAYLGGADVYYYDLVKENDFMPDLTRLPEEILKRTKYIVLSYPSNPVGAAAPKSMYSEIIEYAKKYKFFIVNDNAYSDIIFDGNEGYSFLSIPGAKDVGVEFFSLSKSFNLTGFRIAYLIGNESIVKSLRLLRSQFDFGMSYPAQRAAIAALTGPLTEVKAQCLEYQHRRDALCEGLRSIGWNVFNSDGTMFTWLPIPKGYSSVEFCDLLMEKTGVIGTPGTAFGSNGEGYIRFALVKSVDEFKEIVDVIDSKLEFKDDKVIIR